MMCGAGEIAGAGDGECDLAAGAGEGVGM